MSYGSQLLAKLCIDENNWVILKISSVMPFETQEHEELRKLDESFWNCNRSQRQKTMCVHVYKEFGTDVPCVLVE